jgi:putative addiction module CopG family antidote
MNINLGDLETYVQQKVDNGGYSSAAEVVREALCGMREREVEAHVVQRLETYILRGIDQGAPDGMSTEEWDKRLTATRERMHHSIMQGVEAAERGERMTAKDSRARLQKRFKA